ncbi:hypothetical protein [Micromonospora ureilytica]|uniref:hypothetical protein n=1 Tax=Micromonospora ureilytica TaxID=709868 RepID=UPI002E148D05|nr:hypothetical protein OHB55_03425 [Micromonospora ureilytica]
MRKLRELLAGSRSARLYALGGFLLVGSLVITAVLAFKGADQKNPLTTLETWLLGFFAALLQIGAGASFMSVGKADPTHAKSSVRHLQSLGLTAQKGRYLAEQYFDGGSAAERRMALGQLSVYLSEIEEKASLAVEDWADFHGDAVAALLLDSSDRETK